MRAAPLKRHSESETLLYTTLALAFWLLLILFTALGVYRLLELFGKPKAVDWLLLPGTIVAELAYVSGCLLTGAEVRSATLFPSAGRGKTPTTQTTPKIKVIGPVLSALVAMGGCIAVIVAAHGALGEPVIREFIVDETDVVPTMGPTLSGLLPTTAQEFWDFPAVQVRLVRKMYETWLATDWLDWRAGLFVYLTLCLSIRLAPIRRPIRPALGAAVVAPILLAISLQAGADLSTRIDSLWLILTYIWSTLLLVLLIVSLIRGGIYLADVLRGKNDGTRG